MSEKKERIRPGCVYQHPILKTLGMVMWAGKYRDAITGKLEPACKILWADRNEETLFNSTIYEAYPFVGIYRKRETKTIRFPGKVGYKSHRHILATDEGEDLLIVTERPDDPPATPTERIMQAWRERVKP